MMTGKDQDFDAGGDDVAEDALCHEGRLAEKAKRDQDEFSVVSLNSMRTKSWMLKMKKARENENPGDQRQMIWRKFSKNAQ